jgi:DNA (cytosine-5)-methyltransferase 1
MSKIKRLQVDISGKGYKSQQDRFYEEGGDMCAIPSTRTENKINIIVDMKALYPNTTRGKAIKEKNNSPALDHNCNIVVDPFNLTQTKDQNNATSLRTNYSNGNTQILKNKSIRRLTEIECERLQGFPDNWTQGISSTQRYKALGNAVSVPIVKMIIERLYKCP